MKFKQLKEKCLSSGPKENLGYKFLFGFIYGTISAAFIYLIMIGAFDLGSFNFTKNVIIIPCALLVGVLCGLFTSTRCLLTLAIPGIVLGKGARALIATYQTILLVQGAMSNIGYNADQMSLSIRKFKTVYIM